MPENETTPAPTAPTWKLTLEEVDGELTFELEGDCPSYFELYGLMIHLALNDLQKAYEDAQGS